MTTMNLEIYDALIQANFPEKPARTIATVLDRATKKEATELKTDIQDLKVDTQATKGDIKNKRGYSRLKARVPKCITTTHLIKSLFTRSIFQFCYSLSFVQ